MGLASCVALLKDIALTGAAVVGAYVAAQGLTAWRTQLHGKTEYDLARRLLLTLFRYRDAIYGVREPFMSVHEMPAPPDETAEKMTFDELQFYGTSRAYQARWDLVQKERASLYADLLEAEVLWGLELQGKFDPLFNLEHELRTYIRNFLIVHNPATQEGRKEAYQRHISAKRDVMYDESTEADDDSYKKEFKIAITAVEEYLKAKLIQT